MSDPNPNPNLFGGSSKLLKPSDRRHVNISESSQMTTKSSRTVSLEAAIQQSLRLEEKLEEEAKDVKPGVALKYMLSFKSIVSTSSSNAERQQAAIGTSVQFREIGTGSIGKVFEHPGTTLCYKLPLLDRSDKLWNNYTIHMRVQDSFDQVQMNFPTSPVAVEIPRTQWFANAMTRDFWDESIDRFPFDNQFARKAREVLCMERVFPLPKPIRDNLISLYCPPDYQAAARSNASNQDCLIRPMLGTRKYGGNSRFAINLRNYKLFIEQFKDLQLDAKAYAQAMADALAILHWHTCIDAMDVEFVLGSAPVEEQAVRRPISVKQVENMKPGTSTFELATTSGVNFKKRIICLWLLDFDACKSIQKNPEGVKAAADAFMATDAQCPRPGMGHAYADNLWKDFSTQYISRGQVLLGDLELNGLPMAFINAVEGLVREKAAKSSGPSSAPSTPSRPAARGDGSFGSAHSRGGSSTHNRGGGSFESGHVRGGSSTGSNQSGNRNWRGGSGMGSNSPNWRG